jgi:hypothetical protein
LTSLRAAQRRVVNSTRSFFLPVDHYRPSNFPSVAAAKDPKD